MELLGLHIHLVISAPQVSQQQYYNIHVCVHVSACIDEPLLEGGKPLEATVIDN